jgi:hypothetical protein
MPRIRIELMIFASQGINQSYNSDSGVQVRRVTTAPTRREMCAEFQIIFEIQYIYTYIHVFFGMQGEGGGCSEAN